MRLDVPSGWAWIVPKVLQTPADTMDNFRYIIRSTGYATDPSQGSTSLATHTVAQFAAWQTPWLSAPSAALIAANGVQAIARNGPIRITGIDLACGATISAMAGVRVPADPMYLDVAAATVTRTPAGPPTRLNSLQGPPSLRTQLMDRRFAFANPENRVQFSSCYIQQALGSEKGFIPIENTWIDNWATF